MKGKINMFKENKSFYLFVIGTLVFISTIAGITVGTSDFLVNSKDGLILLICSAATIVICWVVNYKNTDLAKNFKATLSEVEQDRNKYIEKSIELAKECDALKEQLEDHNPEATKAKYEILKNKCDAIEAFQNSFPYKISDEYILYNIMRTNLQIGKASTWQIVGDHNGDLWTCNIVRPHMQTYNELLTLIASTKRPAEISTLNQSETLLFE